MGVIKAEQIQQGSDGEQHVIFNFEDMTVSADKYLAGVRKQAQQILQEAQKNAAKLIEQGKQEALAKAKDAWRQEVFEKQIQPAISKLTSSIEADRANWQANWEQYSVRLAIRIAEHIVGQEIRQTPAIQLRWIRDALEVMSKQERIIVYLSPADVDTLGPHISALLEQLGRIGDTQIIPSKELKPGDCKVATSHGEIEHVLSEKMKRIEEELT